MTAVSGARRPRRRRVDGEARPALLTLALLLAALFATSGSLLALQIALTRILSVVLSYHYVFAVVSLALLGLGLGGIVAYRLRPERLSAESGLATLALLLALAALATAGALHLVLAIAGIPAIHDVVLLHFLVITVPFLLGGVAVASIFRIYAPLSPRLYGADLIGAASGAVLVVLALDGQGAISTVLGLAVGLALAACLLALAAGAQPRALAATLALPLAAMLYALEAGGILAPEVPIGANPDKEIHDALARGGFVEETRWSAFGRTDLVAFADDPGFKDIYIDGTAGTPMYRFSGDIDEPGEAVAALRTEFPGYFPFRFLGTRAERRALVIGPGGGRDILLARLAGIRDIVAVEVNADLIDIVRDQRAYNGGIYDGLEGVTVVAAEGRNYLKRTRGSYDVILLSLPVTNTSRSREGFALTESFLLTTASLGEYLDTLTDDGRLVIVAHDEAEVLRLVTMAASVLQGRDIDARNALNHVYVLGSFPYPVFVLHKRPIAPQAAVAIQRGLLEAGYSPTASWVPHINRPGLVNPALLAVAQGRMSFRNLVDLVEARGINARPVSDDSPFFYNLEPGAPGPVRLVSALALAGVLLVVALPLWMWRAERGAGLARPGRSVVVFALLGTGFMLVEIALVQRFMLFLGQPVLTLAVLLLALLLAAGLGSIASARVPALRLGHGLAAAGCVVAGLIALYTFALPYLLDAFLGLSLPARVAIAMLALAPLGFAQGFPFPLALRALRERQVSTRIPWMWAINGMASVLGAALAVELAIARGFTLVLLLGAGCYLGLALACLGRRGRPSA